MDAFFFPKTDLDQLTPCSYNTSDGIPDIVESILSNSTYFWEFYNFTQKDDWMSEYREKLWNDDNWTISYYFSLKLNESYDSIFPFGGSINKVIKYASAGIVSLNIVNHFVSSVYEEGC